METPNEELTKKNQTIGCGCLVFMVLAFGGCVAFLSNSPETVSENPPIEEKIGDESSQAFPVTYELLRTEDISLKAMTKPLSSYTVQEIEALPLNKRVIYRVSLPPTIKQAQIEPTLRKVISDGTATDLDIDEVTVYAYSDPKNVDGPYDIGSAIWAVNGEYGNMTPQIASSNNRANYLVSVDIEPDIESYLSQRNAQEEKFGFTEKQRRDFFKEIVAAEEKASAAAEETYPPDVDAKKYSAYAQELQAQYLAEIRERNGYSEEVEDDIGVEGLLENWPLK